jgi:acyl transferase
MAPGYERQIYHYAALSHVLVAHGYATIRFDLRNHLGLSSGSVEDFSMESMAEDFRLMLDFLSKTGSAERPAVIAPSLSARAAVRALSGSLEATSLIALIPVVDVRYSLARLMGADLLPTVESGEIRDFDRLYLLGRQQVKAAAGREVIDQDWGGIEEARQELAEVNCPVLAIAAENDEWVRTEDVPKVLEGPSSHPRTCKVVETSSHKIGQNLPVMRLILQLAVEELNRVHGGDATVRIPEFEEMASIMAAERDWASGGYRRTSGAMAP